MRNAMSTDWDIDGGAELSAEDSGIAPFLITCISEFFYPLRRVSDTDG
jgi:hypothetical protein